MTRALDPVVFERVGGLQRFVHGDPGADDRDVVLVRRADDPAATDLELLVGPVDHRRVRSRACAGTRCLSCRPWPRRAWPSDSRRTDGARRCEWIARSDAMSSSAICDGPSSPIETPACEPASRRSTRLIAAMRTKSYAREKNAAKVETNAFQPTRVQADRRGDELLLRDVHLEEPIRVRLLEDLREGRVAHLAVECDDIPARCTQRSEGFAVRLARGDLVARARSAAARAATPGSDAARRAPASRRRRGYCGCRRALRSPRRDRRAACRASRSCSRRP